jgi:hypothetical protein
VGSATNPISATTQKLEKGVAATSTPSLFSTITFNFETPPAGITWTGTISCPDAPSTAVFTATIGGTQWGTWNGAAVFGPVQIQGQGSQQLVVEGTGIPSNTTFEIWLLGSSDQTSNVAPIWPESTAVTGNVSATFQAPVTLYNSSLGLTAVPTVIYNEIQQINVTSVLITLVSGVPNLRAGITVTNTSTNQSWTIVTADWIIEGGETGSNNNMYFPISAAAGQTLQVIADSSGDSVGMRIQIVALSQYPSVFVQTENSTALSVRNSGGLSNAQISTPAINTNYLMLAAAANGYCYRIWNWGTLTLVGVATGSATIFDALGRLDGITLPGTGVTTAVSSKLNGQLTTGPVYVNYNTTPVTPGFFLRYDIIPTPSFGIF